MWKINKKFGFSLIEIMIAIAIMAILSSAMISLIGPASRQRARDARRWSDLQSIASALELYRANVGTYVLSADIAGLEFALEPNYMKSVPLTDPKGVAYTYRDNNSNGKLFELCGTFEKLPSNGCNTNPCCVYNP